MAASLSDAWAQSGGATRVSPEKANDSAKKAQEGGASTNSAASLGSLCWLTPASHCYAKGDGVAGVNDFYGTAQSYSFISQAKSVYNGKAGSNNASVDLASLNFPLRFKAIFTTNAQLGVTTKTIASGGSALTLSSASAAQAAQNMINGGTFNSSFLFPLVFAGPEDPSAAGEVIFTLDAIATGGIDFQDFKACTSTTAVNPPTHANVGLESFVQINSDEPCGGDE